MPILPSPTDSADAEPPVHRAAALASPSFRFYLVGNAVALFGMQMQRIAVEWDVWHRTNSAPALGYVGLTGVAPTLLLTLVVGHAADRFDRKQIVRIAQGIVALASLGLALISAYSGPVPAIYGCLLVSGIARAFQQPAKQSLMPLIVPRHWLLSAITLNTGAFQLAAAAGPALAGLLIAVRGGSATLVYWLQVGASLVFLAMLMGVKVERAALGEQLANVRSVAAGVVFVFRKKLLLGAMALDLFAVLLGGAAALYPVYATDVFKVGATGLGWMRAMQAIGALAMGVVVAVRPPMRRAGWTMLWAVAGFGAATIVFGLSRSFPLALAMIFLIGAFDMISVVVRQTLIQLATPDAMRGRVSAVNMMFIGASNDLGDYESGTVAHFTSPTFSVVSGGVGAIVVVALTAIFFPQLRRYGRLDGGEPHYADGAMQPASEGPPPPAIQTRPR